METQRVLVVEPELEARLFLATILEGNGFSTATAPNGAEAESTVRNGSFCLVLLSAELPDRDGLDCVKELRETSGLPIVVVSARSESGAVVAALDAGADDYLAKPLDPDELMGRLRAVLRRSERPSRIEPPLALPTLAVGALQVDFSAQVAMIGERDLNLSGKELHLLYLLTQNVGKLLSRGHIFQEVWGGDVLDDSKTLDVHVSRLRKKLDDAGGYGALLKTIRNRGYMLSSEVGGTPAAQPQAASQN